MVWLYRWYFSRQRDLRCRLEEAEKVTNRTAALGEEPRKGSGTLAAAKEGDLSGEYITGVVLHCQIPILPYFRRI